jgi:hypothetical protein
MLIGPDPFGANYDHSVFLKARLLLREIGLFTDAMKKGFYLTDRMPYQLYYLDCCKSEMYYRDIFRDFVGSKNIDLLNKWFCDYKIVGQVQVLIRELMAGSDFATIASKMNHEYGIVHFDMEDDPEDIRQDRKMISYSIGKE